MNTQIKLSIFTLWAACALASSSQGARLAEEPLNGPGYEIGRALTGLSGGTGWKEAWNGPSDTTAVQQPGLSVAGIQAAAMRAQVSGTGTGTQVFRSLKDALGAEGTTVWIGFVMQKKAGKRFFGLSCFQDAKEKLFVGTPHGSDRIRFGPSALTQESATEARQIAVRIDFHGAKSKAYLFVDPSLASDPDVEGANATAEGDFSFNKIRLAMGGEAEGGTGSFGPILVGQQFSDVVNRAQTGDAPAVTGDKLSVTFWEEREGALWVTTSGGLLKLQPFLDQALQVQFGTRAGIDKLKSYAVARKPEPVKFTTTETADTLVLKSPRYSVKVSKATSQIAIYDAAGALLVQESPTGGRRAVLGESVTVADRFLLTPSEALYGLGQFKDNALNLRGKRRELVQVNTQAAVPVLLSTHGWGLFWDNPSRTIFADGAQGMSFISDIGSAVSFYVFVGAQLDDLVGGYRQLTGAAPMLPRWALGYHQSRNKYRSQEEVLSVSKRIREEKIPMDSIFIDYFYWDKNRTGSHRFDATLFPDVPEMIRQLHEEHTKAVITVWPTFRPGTANYEALHKEGFILEGAKALDGSIYDVFNPKAGDLYWKQVAEQLVPLGIDGYFLDGPEPDNVTSFLTTTTFAGPAAAVRNIYPLLHSTVFYNGLCAAHPNQRPYILTRCAWASQQRNGTAIWSGDIASTFAELKTQVTAGLSFMASGIPYWTTDIGGYSGGDPADPAYQETYTRWWEYGTFCPIFRSHGRRAPGDTKGPNELWAFGPQVQKICTEFGELRYRLLPYIYSLSGNVTQKSYTPMRLLAFDFPADPKVADLKDQFMYGPALLINPVTTPGATTRELYLPAGTQWIDFWTGTPQNGGQTITAQAPIERIPIYVRAGSILPMGPKIQYTDEKPDSPIELRVYPGANGTFELYEDDGATFDYQKGQFSRIPLAWDDKAQILTIGQRKGSFAGMLKERTFHVVWVGKQNGIGMAEAKSDAIMKYSGATVVTHAAGKR